MADPSTERGTVRILLLGGIGSGKSTVGRMLAQRGAIVIDADRIGHAVLEPGGPAFAGVAARWPDVVVAEAAAVSLAFVTLFGFIAKRLSWENFITSMRETAYQTAALFFIAVGAKIFVSFVSLTGVTHELVDIVSGSGLENWQVLLSIVCIYLVMGMFLDPIGTMLLTLPFVVPLVEGMGYDLIWFGVIVIKLLEIGLITPPVGLNVFVINSVVKGTEVHTIFFGVMKFLILDIGVLILLLSFPILSLFIPNSMF